MPSPASSLPASASGTSSKAWSIVDHYTDILSKDENLAMPVAAVECLAECVARSQASTMQELIVTLTESIEELKARLTIQRPPLHVSFATHKRDIVIRAREFVKGSKACVSRVAEVAGGFIEDATTVMVHGYSRVVTQALIWAATMGKKRFEVFVTESRPFGLGLRTHAILTAQGIPCCVILDSAVAYAMAKCDLVLVGAEGVVENGGLVNYIGAYQMAIAAKAHSKPLYALAESYKFLRLFPLSQYDIPSSRPVLQFASEPDDSTSPSTKTRSDAVPRKTAPSRHPRQSLIDSPMPAPLEPTDAMIANNPLLDYTTPDLISLVISDVGVLTPSGVSDALLASEGFFRR